MHIEKQEFLSNLRLSQAYCALQMHQTIESPIAVLRSLNPTYKEGKLFRYQANTYPALSGKMPPLVVEWHQDADAYDAKFFDVVFEQQLNQKREVLAASLFAKPEGKILVVEYDLNIPDGASAIESEGFVDDLDFPPIDTWFYKCCTTAGNCVLFAWVPEAFATCATEAVKTQFLDILHWFDEWLPVEYELIMLNPPW